MLVCLHGEGLGELITYIFTVWWVLSEEDLASSSIEGSGFENWLKLGNWMERS